MEYAAFEVCRRLFLHGVNLFVFHPFGEVFVELIRNGKVTRYFLKCQSEALVRPSFGVCDAVCGSRWSQHDNHEYHSWQHQSDIREQYPRDAYPSPGGLAAMEIVVSPLSEKVEKRNVQLDRQLASFLLCVGLVKTHGDKLLSCGLRNNLDGVISGNAQRFGSDWPHGPQCIRRGHANEWVRI